MPLRSPHAPFLLVSGRLPAPATPVTALPRIDRGDARALVPAIRLTRAPTAVSTFDAIVYVAP